MYRYDFNSDPLKRKGIMFIPEYIFKVMKEKGITVDKIEAMCKAINYNIENSDNGIIDAFKNKLSLYDLEAIVKVNIIANNLLIGKVQKPYYENIVNILLTKIEDRVSDLIKYNEIDKGVYKEFLTDEYDLQSILMNKAIAYDVVATESILFVIIRPGFTNLLEYKEGRDLLFSDLIDHCFRFFGRDITVQLPFYYNYIFSIMHEEAV